MLGAVAERIILLERQVVEDKGCFATGLQDGNNP
jgi:hypothetical protein